MSWLLSVSDKLWIKARGSIVESCAHLQCDEKGAVSMRSQMPWLVTEENVVCILPCLEHSIGPKHQRQASPEPEGLPGRTLPVPQAHVQRHTPQLGSLVTMPAAQGQCPSVGRWSWCQGQCPHLLQLPACWLGLSGFNRHRAPLGLCTWSHVALPCTPPSGLISHSSLLSLSASPPWNSSHLTKAPLWAWRGGLVVKSPGSSYRGPGFDS